MKNYRVHLKQLAFTLLSVFIFISCQEHSSSDDVTILDEDMIAATDLANDHLNSIDGRRNISGSVTVFRYIDGELKFATDTDNFATYQSVDEETVTASVEPGGYIFWYAGRGVTNLRGIEFDSDSRDKLNGDAREVLRNRLWYVKVPDNLTDLELKYDILYRCIKDRNNTIRLDPKIKIQ